MIKYTLIAISVFLFFNTNASIVYTDNSTGKEVNQSFRDLEIDYNSDGTNDAGVSLSGYLIAWAKIGGGTKYIIEQNGVKALEQGYIIDASNSYSTNGNEKLHEPPVHLWTTIGSNPVIRYLGLKFEINGKTHFGWIRAYLTSDISIKVTGWAYETVADKAIKAGFGASGPVGLEEIATPQFILYPNPTSNILYIEYGQQASEVEQVNIYSLNGQNINSFNGRVSEVMVKDYQPGEYIVSISYNNRAVEVRRIVIR